MGILDDHRKVNFSMSVNPLASPLAMCQPAMCQSAASVGAVAEVNHEYMFKNLILFVKDAYLCRRMITTIRPR